MDYAPCKGCGKPILWAKDDKGQNIPLDPRAPGIRRRVTIEDIPDDKEEAYEIGFLAALTDAAQALAGVGKSNEV